MAPRLRISNVWLNAAETTGISHENDNVVRVFGNAIAVPVGTNANRPAAANGIIRYNVDQGELERVKDGVWAKVATNTLAEIVNAQANAAYGQANLAFGHANIVFGQANTAYSQANLAFNHANIVFGQANTAYSQANLVFVQANTKANINSQAFTGAPTCNTAANTTSNTMIATTQFVQNEFNRRLGKHTIWVPASSLKVVSGGANFVELYLGDQALSVLAFDPSVADTGACNILMPKSWDGGQIFFQSIWLHPSTSTNFGVAWVWNARAISDGEDNASYSVGTTVTDTGGTTSRFYMSPLSAGHTVESSPAGETLLLVRIYREPANGADTMAVDAYLVGFKILYNINQWNDD